MLKLIHYNHLGISKCKNRAREALFWPGMSNDVENVDAACITCVQYAKAYTEQPMIIRNTPDTSWTVLGSDV